MSEVIKLRIVGTHWATPSLAEAGWRDEEYLLNPCETGLVALHLWNVGDHDGPPAPERFYVDMGTVQCQAESLKIARDYIRPAMNAARSAGLAIFHVEPPNIAVKYESTNHMLTENERRLLCVQSRRYSAGDADTGPNAYPGGNWPTVRAERTHGAGYRNWDGWEEMAIISCCDVEQGDQVILTGAQFDRICRGRGIRNLIYTGFATNMCILSSPGGTQEMLGFGYRVFLIREATLAVEYPDTFSERLMTRSAIKYFQQVVGDSVGFDQFMESCKNVARGGEQ